MKIGFLTSSGSMHINIKAKYFSKNDEVYFFAMKMNKGNDPPIRYKDNMKVIYMEHRDEWIDVIKNALNIKKIYKENNIEILHVIEMTFVKYAIALSVLGIKVVIENNGSDVILGPDSAVKRKEYKYAYRLCKAVVQDSLVSQKAGIALGAPIKKNYVIELGVDTDLFNLHVKKGEFRKKYHIPEHAKVIFSPRAFTPLYNIKQIILSIDPVLKKHPDTYYVFCSYRKNRKYENMIRMRTKNVIFLGYVDNEREMPYIYRDSDIVLSIPKSDSSPRTVYEAMACGCCTIVSDLPWVASKFEDKEHLFVTKQNNLQELVQLIIDIIEGKKFINSMIVYQKIFDLMNYKVSAKQLKEIYLEIR